MSQPSFNLVDAPWLPVTRLDGVSEELSLAEIFDRAEDVASLDDASPLCTVALHRLLLAIVYRAIDGPADQAAWRALWRDGLPVAAISAYLEKWRHRFDLFDPEQPFFQVADLVTVTKDGAPTDPSPASVLRPELASGNNKVLFNHSTDAEAEPWPAAVAARSLVSAQAWSLGGGKGPTSNRFGMHPYASHAPLVGGIVVLLQGDNLAQTLLLNLLVHNGDQPMARVGNDRPVWETDEARQPGKVVPLGYLDYLTLPARAVRLLPRPAPSGAWSVSHVFAAQGSSVDEAAKVMSPLWVQRLDDKRGPVPLALRAERAVWRDASALFGLAAAGGRFDSRPAVLRQACITRIARSIGDDARLRVRCYGLVNDKAKPVAWRVEELPATVRLLQDANLVGVVAAANAFAEDVGDALHWSFKVCAEKVLATADKKADKKDVSRVALRMLRHAGFWERLERDFRDFLLDLAPGTRHATLARWVACVAGSAKQSYHHGSKFAQGGIARQLEGVVAGEGALNARLRKLSAPLRPQPPTSKNPDADPGETHV